MTDKRGVGPVHRTGLSNNGSYQSYGAERQSVIKEVGAVRCTGLSNNGSYQHTVPKAKHH